MKYLGKCFRFLPIVLSLGLPISFFITYGIAVGKDHVSWLWPYISDTGTLPPESCVFGLLLNTFSFMLILVIYLKYRLISELVKINKSIKISRFWNGLTAFIGYVSSFGLIVVANFEETSEITVHLTGAVIAFSFGVINFFLQTIFTYRIDPESKMLFRLRLIISVSSLFLLAGFLGPVAPAMAKFKGKNHLKWSEKDGGFPEHLASTFLEWFLLLDICSFFFTVYWDFRNVRIIPPQIKFLNPKVEDSTKDDESRSKVSGEQKESKNSLELIA